MVQAGLGCFVLIYMCECLASMSACAALTCTLAVCTWKAEEGTASPELEYSGRSQCS